MKLSVVATLFQSESYVKAFYQRMSAAARKLVGDDYEIIFVNDGSPDRGLEIAVELTRNDHHIVVIDLSRNFGHHKAMMAGLDHAKGERIFLIDSDLEEEPEWLLGFNEQMDVDQSDVVFGVQEIRKGGVFERWSGTIFYKIFRALSGVKQPDNVVTARLMTARYLSGLLSHREREIYICGLWVITGFKQTSQIVRKHSSSPSTYGLRLKIDLLVNAITAFSVRPLAFTFYSGVLISVSAFSYICYLCLRYFFISSIPSGYTSILVSIWFFSGLIILVLGIQGMYLAKIFSEVKQRPAVIIRRIHRHASHTP